jgi:hypothetical protein
VLVYAVIDRRSSSEHPLGDAVETLVRRADAERLIEEVRGDLSESRGALCGSRSTS